MREIITVHIGICGARIGIQFWETIAQEQSINPDGQSINNNGKVHTYFNETCQHYTPRALFVDANSQTYDLFKAHKYSPLLLSANFIFDNSIADIDWKADLDSNSKNSDQFLEVARKQIEECDSFQGFQIFHSLDGGIGSLKGTTLMSNLRENYPSQIAETFSVIPSSSTLDMSIESYYTALSLNHLLENADMVYIIENDSLANICQSKLNIAKPTYDDFNILISKLITTATHSYRFHCELHSDQYKAATNMVIFPRLHFLTLGMCPYICIEASELSISQMIECIANPHGVLSAIYPDTGKILSSAIFINGKVMQCEADKELLRFYNQNKGYFSSQLPFNTKCEVFSSAGNSMASVLNSTAIADVVRKIKSQFSYLLKRRAFGHYWAGIGIFQIEFEECESNLYSLISEYEQYEC